jgi:hypothetical protein
MGVLLVIGLEVDAAGVAVCPTGSSCLAGEKAIGVPSLNILKLQYMIDDSWQM